MTPKEFHALCSPAHPAYLKAGLRNIAQTTRNNMPRKKRFQWGPALGTCAVLLSALVVLYVVAVAMGWGS